MNTSSISSIRAWPVTAGNQRGTSMIEILIAIVVLSFALLALALLQVVGLKASNSAYQRTQATVLAYDMVDRMRANRVEAEAGDYDVALTVTPAVNNPLTLSRADVREWKAALATTAGVPGGLPEGDGSVTRAGNLATIVVTWTDHSQAAGSTTQTYTLRSQL